MFVLIQQHGGRMSTGFQGIRGLPELKTALNFSLVEIQLSHSRTIPQADPRPAALPVDDDGVGICCRNVFTRAYVKRLHNPAGSNIEQNDIVREIVRYDQPVAVIPTQNSKPSGIR